MSSAAPQPSVGTSRVPLLDLSPLVAMDADEAARARAAEEIARASQTWGVFLAAGHGVPDRLMDDVFGSAGRLFALPDEMKRRLASADRRPGLGRGFDADRGPGPDRPRFLEAYLLGPELSDEHPRRRAGDPLFHPNQWPDLPGWRLPVLGYLTAVARLAELVIDAQARALGLVEDLGLGEGDPLVSLSLERHAPAGAGAARTSVAPSGAWSFASVLAQDRAAGLEIEAPDGSWVPVPYEPGLLLISVGDLMSRWTNDVLRAPKVRSRAPERGDRIVLRVQRSADPDTVVVASPGCVGPDRPARYPPVTPGAVLLEGAGAPVPE
ncbi:MAG: 2-oxoglutarate and iron-dependent oxygenase domain-containing protein [Actinomycetota bacterium]|nr:2-oxoglutarate and iron-dependent oxygenase domain-containing protein [Actinomycetota bacterium]